MQLGALRFGDAFDAAAHLGRPDKLAWTQTDYCELLYTGGGFQLDFSRGKFAHVAFFIGPDNYLPKHRVLEFSTPPASGMRAGRHMALARHEADMP